MYFVKACALVSTLTLVFMAATILGQPPSINQESETMKLGNFSISLTVKDIAASREFYEKLDFQKVGGNQEQNWLVMQNGATTVGLFQGMFENNILTFNPGWNHKKETLDSFDDVRAIQSVLQKRGIEMIRSAEPEGDQPDSIVFTDPDGNVIMLDQHVPKPD